MESVAAFLHRLAEYARPLAEEYGAPGLAVVAFIDSSFLTLPEASDLLIILLTVRVPDEWFVYPLAATAGSLAGSYALFAVGRRGGEGVLRRRFPDGVANRGLSWFRRHGAWTLVVPAMMPPPMPFKVFVLAAGVSGVPTRSFLLAVLAGRGLRYVGVALLARRYGAQAMAVAQAHLMEIVVGGVVAVVIGSLGWWVWRRLSRRRHPPAQPGLP